MKNPQTLTPTLSRKREREQEIVPSPSDSLARTRQRVQEQEQALVQSPADPLSRLRERAQEQEQPLVSSPSDPLSRVRERAGVRVRARALRKGQTDAEGLLWSRLRSRQLGNLKFRRQRPIGPYFADFACLEIGLVIELDGGQHAENAGVAHDQKRSDIMEALGFQTLRFWNNDVLLQTEAVLEKILQFAGPLTPTLSRTPASEQENTKGNTP